MLIGKLSHDHDSMGFGVLICLLPAIPKRIVLTLHSSPVHLTKNRLTIHKLALRAVARFTPFLLKFFVGARQQLPIILRRWTCNGSLVLAIGTRKGNTPGPHQ